jgi:hypothetical protein
MDITKQVFSRSFRMGIAFVIIGVATGLLLAVLFGSIPHISGQTSSTGQTVDLGQIFGFLIVPVVALAGLIITTPVYLLFVNDKNAGVLEYLLAVGMSQRDIFEGYLKAALLLSLVAIAPPLIVNVVLSPNGLLTSLEAGALALITGCADVALVTVLMTSFSSMQRKPTGMNSPLGMTVGVFIVFPEFLTVAALGGAAPWIDFGIAAGVLVTALLLLLSFDRLISREKLLP